MIAAARALLANQTFMSKGREKGIRQRGNSK